MSSRVVAPVSFSVWRSCSDGRARLPHLQRRAHHRDGEVALVIAVAVPVHDRNDVARPDAEIGQRARQPAQPVAELPVGVPALLEVCDDLIGRSRERRVQAGA